MDTTPTKLQEQLTDVLTRLDTAQAMILERDIALAKLQEDQSPRYDLFALRDCADYACTAARTECPDCLTQPINWGDLGCISAEYYVDEFGNVGHRVWIEEADPSSYHLRDFVRGYLSRHGYESIDVMLDW